MQLSLNPLATMRSIAIAAAQAACTTLLDLTSGSPARGLIEADLGQWLIQQSNLFRVLSAARLATSFGADVDTFVGDYGLVREAPSAATGTATFSRFSALGSATVLVGQTVRTADLTQTYVVGADATNPAFTATIGTSGGYVLAAGVSSVTVPITDLVAGSAGNVVSGAVSLFGSAVAGVDLVSNGAPTVGGLDAETDAALKARFVLYISSLEKATLTAVQSAIAGVQQGLTYAIEENTDEQGRFRPGHFVVTLDDGSGGPSAILKATVYSAIDLVRPVGSTFSVQSPTVDLVTVSMILTVSSGNKLALVSAIQTAVTSYINTLPPGGTISATKIAALAYSTSPLTISNVTQIFINGSPNDYPTVETAVVKVQSVAVN